MTKAGQATNNAGFTYLSLVETHKKFSVVPGANGNFYEAEYTEIPGAGTTLGVLEGVAAIDEGARPISYNPQMLEQLGVSRLRLTEEEQIPRPNDMVVLKAINTDGSSDTPNPLFAVTTSNEALILVMCNYASPGAASKLFVVKDQRGIDALNSQSPFVRPILEHTVLGGKTTSCNAVSLIFGNESTGQQG